MRASSVRLFRVNELLSRFYVNYVLTIPVLYVAKVEDGA
jgi:hypothetical protein